MKHKVAAVIGVVSSFRRRGIAGALTTRLVQEAFNKGVTVAFLMAAHEAEERIYTPRISLVLAKFCSLSLPCN
ncbi:MAG: GNAT family N-acetyltransferase [Mojavia pulchra JT2-VF2]|uniref:GNAT family N-acetyltransferase n=1 Tax=Mojavia pulchra JT2-VF2 TaxID=287848 RepID=A0A951Q836_9NOST|nr:GNAT family N-acetyltransferase [Mojavia pulchra JT2-VF2]